MKKIYLITLTYLFISLISNAQSTYYKMLKEDTTTWQHFGAYVGVKAAYSATIAPYLINNSIAAIDTVTINSKLYKRLFHLQTPATLNYANKSFMGFIREDTIAKKVYFKTPSSSEIVLYDFSLNVNDSIYIGFPNLGSLSGYYRVDSIVNRNEVNGQRKHFYYRKHVGNWNQNTYYFDITEGVGSSFHLLYLYTSYMGFGTFASTNQTCYHPWDLGMACKHDDDQKQFQSCTYSNFIYSWFPGNTPGDPCNYWVTIGGLKNNDWNNVAKIGPNPSNDQLIIKIDQDFEDVLISLFDMSGKFVADALPKLLEKNTYELNTKDLAQGVYIVKVKINGTLITRPIVVQH